MSSYTLNVDVDRQVVELVLPGDLESIADSQDVAARLMGGLFGAVMLCHGIFGGVQGAAVPRHGAFMTHVAIAAPFLFGPEESGDALQDPAAFVASKGKIFGVTIKAIDDGQTVRFYGRNAQDVPWEAEEVSHAAG